MAKSPRYTSAPATRLRDGPSMGSTIPSRHHGRSQRHGLSRRPQPHTANASTLSRCSAPTRLVTKVVRSSCVPSAGVSQIDGDPATLPANNTSRRHRRQAGPRYTRACTGQPADTDRRAAARLGGPLSLGAAEAATANRCYPHGCSPVTQRDVFPAPGRAAIDVSHRVRWWANHRTADRTAGVRSAHSP